MILTQDEEQNWTVVDGRGRMTNVHDPANCEGRGCAIHNHPSDHPLKDATLNWRQDRGILERICKHGVGHPDMDSASYLDSIGQGFQNVHGCDGCCAGVTFDLTEEETSA